MKTKNNSYTNNEVEKINWHDSEIVSISSISKEFKLKFEMNLITKWNYPENQEQEIVIEYANAIVLFYNAYNLDIDIITDSIIMIDQLTRNNKKKNVNTGNVEWEWTIDCQQGKISFYATGFDILLL